MVFYRTKKCEDIRSSDFNADYYVYTDGACSNNGKSNALCGIGIFFAEGDSRNVSKKVEGKQTNNTAELTAIIETYKLIESDISSGKMVSIVSDSEYAIKCVTTYGDKCYKKLWNVDIPNKELVKKAYELYKDKSNVKFLHIMAHTGKNDIHSIGNENADKLANLAIGVDVTTLLVNSKILLNVPFARKEDAKQLGAKWDPMKKKWYIMNDNVNKDVLLAEFSL